MDEGALRKLLEATADLAERRQIRSAIRELRRQELEGDGEALASKRFRPEQGGSRRRENKENWLRSQRLEEEQAKALELLAGKLDSITDVEELTVLLRGAGEYEERKLIRAAIRKLRAQEIEAAAAPGRAAGSRRGETEAPGSLAGARSETPEDQAPREQGRAPIRAPCGQRSGEPPKPEAPDSSSGPLLLLHPEPGQSPASPCAPEGGGEPEARGDSEQPEAAAGPGDPRPKLPHNGQATISLVSRASGGATEMPAADRKSVV